MLVCFQQGKDNYYVVQAMTNGRLVSFSKDKSRAKHFSQEQYESILRYNQEYCKSFERKYQ